MDTRPKLLDCMLRGSLIENDGKNNGVILQQLEQEGILDSDWIAIFIGL